MELSFQSIIKWINTPFFYLGKSPITLSGLGTAIVIVIMSLIVAKVVCRVLEKNMNKRLKLSSGVTYAIIRFCHYGIIMFGVFIAAQTIGLNLGSLAVVFGFLSVGIGFGLQNVTSNFISGLILLIERPVAVGDFVNVGGETGSIRHINMRSTVVKTMDNVMIVVPNSKFIEENVVNWSLEDSRVRFDCPVGVAYGSDVPKVKQVLLDVAGDHEDVLKHPVPEVRFKEFGNSSLDFSLLVWISDPTQRARVRSDLNYKIDDGFRANNIEIPFPQRDLNLKMTPALKELRS